MKRRLHPIAFIVIFVDIDELAIALIDRAGVVLRQILNEARTKSVFKNKTVLFVVQLKFLLLSYDADEGNLSLLLREGYTGSSSYKQAVERQLNLLSARITR